MKKSDKGVNPLRRHNICKCICTQRSTKIYKANITDIKGEIESNTIFGDFNTLLTSWIEGLPWWHSGWESACQCRGQGFDPWSRKIPHPAEQLSPCTTTTEPAL